jgi:tetratricopeptide (TPR) repeat protein
MVGKLTYGASADKALEHFERALELTPEAPIAHIEYGNGLYLLFGDKRLEESNAAYEKAAKIKPIDAMQKLDVEYAKASV